MATFRTKPVAKPPKDVSVDLSALSETIEPPASVLAPVAAPVAMPEPSDAAPIAPEEPVKRGKGRPPSPDPRVVFGTRLRSETIADVEALKTGLRLKMQGEAIERAVAFYKAHILAKTRQELHLAPEVDDGAVLLKSFKVDD